MYILRCADDSTYVGSTVDLENRLWQHNRGEGARYTSGRLPVTLAYCETVDDVGDAFRREKQVQNWSRQKREALISGNITALKKGAKKKFVK